MPHQSIVSQTNNGTTPVHQISNLIYETIVFLQQQYPERLKIPYQNIRWDQPQHQTKLLSKLNEKLAEAKTPEELRSKVQGYLKYLLISEAIANDVFNHLQPHLEQILKPDRLSPQNYYLYPDQKNSSVSHLNRHGIIDNGVSILLLDAENIQLDVEVEKFLEKICHYPLQVRVAFANWRSLGKKDTEFHQRGYQLIHVPAGKDSADLKMATVGSSIFVHYPTAKEVLVCSSDQALIHLCNTLQSHGLTVYHVRKNKDQIIVFNSQNGSTQNYSLASPKIIPKVEELLQQLQQLIQAEQKRCDRYWIKLARISSIYRNQYKLTLTQVISEHFVDFKVQDIFIKNPHIFAVHKTSEKSHLYVTLFNEVSGIYTHSSFPQPGNNLSTNLTAPEKISSAQDLEDALVTLIKELTKNSPDSLVSLSILASKFSNKYGIAINKLLREFNNSKKFPKFLESCPSLDLQETSQGWQVGLLHPRPVNLASSI